jgi:hypothetical protein
MEYEMCVLFSSTTFRYKLFHNNNKVSSVALVCEQTIPSKQQPLVSEANANVCG